MIVLLFILVAIFAEVLAPYPFAEVHPADRLQGASTKYLLGTDHLGRDFLSRLIYGARLSLMVGLAATTLNVGVGVLIGGLSGFIGGKFDLAVQRFVDAWMSFPGLLLLLTIMSIVGRGACRSSWSWEIRGQFLIFYLFYAFLASWDSILVWSGLPPFLKNGHLLRVDRS